MAEWHRQAGTGIRTRERATAEQECFDAGRKLRRAIWDPVASGLGSLLRGAAQHLQAGTVVSNLTELEGGLMFTMSVSSGASLLALASHECDIGQVAHELADLINKVGPALTPSQRYDRAVVQVGSR